MHKQEFPILEYDSFSPNIIDAKKNIVTQQALPTCCVLTFFGDAFKEFISDHQCEHIGILKLESIVLPIYLYKHHSGKEIALLHALGSGPYAAGQLEKLIAMGCNHFMVCGGCGVLVKGSTGGDIYVPISAVRDEGTSYHYMKPSREVLMDNRVREIICHYLNQRQIPYKCVKTWTTDAMYRETRDLVNLRINEGCQVVEMECASYYAVARYKQVLLGQLLYAGDDLSGNAWDDRKWKLNQHARRELLKLSIDLCAHL